MIYIERKEPIPQCLKEEKNKEISGKKKDGDYKCSGVVPALKEDFFNKCYICESRSSSLNVEHFQSHRGEPDRKFDWYNLYLACYHCNNIKGRSYDDILDCTNQEHLVEEWISCDIDIFPYSSPEFNDLCKVESLKPKTVKTIELLNKVYNGTTELKEADAENLVENLIDNLEDFIQSIRKYLKATDLEDKKEHLESVKNHLHSSSEFTSFKRWKIRKTPKLLKEFSKYLV